MLKDTTWVNLFKKTPYIYTDKTKNNLKYLQKIFIFLLLLIIVCLLYIQYSPSKKLIKSLKKAQFNFHKTKENLTIAEKKLKELDPINEIIAKNTKILKIKIERIKNQIQNIKKGLKNQLNINDLDKITIELIRVIFHRDALKQNKPLNMVILFIQNKIQLYKESFLLYMQKKGLLLTKKEQICYFYGFFQHINRTFY